MRIETGAPESHPSPLPLDESQSPGVAPPTAIASAPSPGNQVGVFDATADQSARLGGYEADIRGAQATGMAAEHQRRQHYGEAVLPQGASYGDAVTLPPVAANAVPTEGSDAYPWSGTEPVPATVGFYHPPGPLPE
jgi:hypothetical protein